MELGQFVCPSSGVYSLYTKQLYMSYSFVDSFRAGPRWNSMEFHPVVLLDARSHKPKATDILNM